MPLDNLDTTNDYTNVLTSMMLGLLRGESSQKRTDYSFPTTAEDREAIGALAESLKKGSSSEIEAGLHGLACRVFLEQGPGSAPRGRKKMDNLLEALLAVMSVKEDGNLQDAKRTTPLLARVLYVIRCTLIWEANASAVRENSSLEM